MQRKDGVLILSNEEDFDFFQGIFITIIPKEESKNGKDAFIVEEHNSKKESNSLSTAWTDEIPIGKENDLKSFKKRIYKYLTKKHFETVRMGFPEIAIDNSILELF